MCPFSEEDESRPPTQVLRERFPSCLLPNRARRRAPGGGDESFSLGGGLPASKGSPGRAVAATTSALVVA